MYAGKPGPRPVHPSPVPCYRPRSTLRNDRSFGDAPPILPRTITGINLPVRIGRGKSHRKPVTDAVLIARARFNTGLQP